MDTTIALITGANKGIGFETARRLAAGGATVLLGARDDDRGRAAEERLRGEGADARFVQLDVTDADSVRAAAKWVEAEFGRLDVLINNVGIARAPGQPLDAGWLPSQTSLQAMREIFEVNVSASSR